MKIKREINKDLYRRFTESYKRLFDASWADYAYEDDGKRRVFMYMFDEVGFEFGKQCLIEQTISNLKNYYKEYCIIPTFEATYKVGDIKAIMTDPYILQDFSEDKALHTDFMFIGEGGFFTCRHNVQESGAKKVEDPSYFITCIITSENLEAINSCIVEAPKDEKKKYVNYMTKGANGFTSQSMEVKDFRCDIDLNYNDSLPHDQLVDFVEGEQSGLAILHGTPGCGKTTYIRNLIYNSNSEFFLIDSSVFAYITDSSFIGYLLRNSNAVYILEDCEQLLTDRTQSWNGGISGLLNISDGILGDSLNIKFICTFNSDLSSIDNALLRKGRLKVKYEFGNLTPEKTLKLGTSLGIPEEELKGKSLPLCDIYNYNVQTGNKVKERKKIGFA